MLSWQAHLELLVHESTFLSVDIGGMISLFFNFDSSYCCKQLLVVLHSC